MAKLIYVTNVSLDSYIEDEHGDFDWSDPNDEVFAFITNLVRSVGTHLYGRRLYESMAVWETDPVLSAQSELMGEFANVWQAAEKVVYADRGSLHATAGGEWSCRRGDSNPHRAMLHQALNLARLPIPPLRPEPSECTAGLSSRGRSARRC